MRVKFHNTMFPDTGNEVGAHGDILNLNYAYVYCVYESRLRGLFMGRVFETVFE